MSWRRALAPLAGTFAFLAISLPRTASAIIHATHYQGRTVFQAFSPIAGVENTLRTLADNQVVGALGIYRATAFDWPAVLVIDAALIVLTIALWRIVAMKSLLVVGIAFILGSDLLVYSARADWSYVNQVHRWTRYHLFPHLGLALVLIAGLTGARPHLLRLLPNNRLTTMQTIGIAVLIAALSLAHVSRAAGSHIHIAEAGDLMRQLDRLEDACRRYGISGDTARAALDFRQMPVGYRGDNAFDLLRCSPNPRPMSRDEAAAVLRSVQ